MANPTSNFGWQMPTPTDLVTDLPADFEVFGQAVDTSLADLKGGTSGQVLSKNSNTDMDFVWVTSDDANAIQNTIINAKGDLITGTANDTPAVISVGANNRVLMADSTAATGLKYGGDWVSYTPTFTNLTVGNGTLSGAYSRVGDTIFVRVRLNWGSTTAITASSVTMSTPTSYDADYENLGNITMWGLGGAGNLCSGVVWAATPSSVQLMALNSGVAYAQMNDISATVPFTWGTSNRLAVQFFYKVA